MTLHSNVSSPRILRLPDVITQTGMSRSSIYSRMKAGSFPQAVHLGPRTVGWMQSDVDGFIHACVAGTEARHAFH